jgi:hypothetical protein
MGDKHESSGEDDGDKLGVDMDEEACDDDGT